MEPSIRNPKIILVTDRFELDDQITRTFRKCGRHVDNATTGQRLVDLLESKSDSVVTTIINKFVAAVKKIKEPLPSQDIFVLVDEGHRTQHGTFNIDMQKTLPNACFIAFTGTPLFKKDKSTAAKFGGIIDAYTVDQAVKDKAVVQLLYEGRLARQNVNESPLDTFFGMVSEPLTDYQKADFKKKFSRADQLNSAEQKIYAIAWNISLHYRDNWQGNTPFKGQLVCDKKINAIRYKEFLDEIGIVSSEVLISSIDEREGEDSAYEKSTEKENRFWKRMMDEHGNAKTYEKNIISRFKNQRDPETQDALNLRNYLIPEKRYDADKIDLTDRYIEYNAVINLEADEGTGHDVSIEVIGKTSRMIECHLQPIPHNNKPRDQYVRYEPNLNDGNDKRRFFRSVAQVFLLFY